MPPLSASSWMIPGTFCWAEVGEELSTTPFMFTQCSITEVLDANNVVVLLNGNTVPQKIAACKLHRANQSQKEANAKDDHTGIADMVVMDQLNEAEIISNLRGRYEKDVISTFIGPTLIVMNPYKRVVQTKTYSKLMDITKSGQKVEYRSIVPETAAIAAQSFSMLFTTQKSQAIVISGESGAGKTENAKICLAFLTSAASGEGVGNSSENNIAEKIMSCNPILEAFGNAKTMRNENSSRFGKFISLTFDARSKSIKNAYISSYLLEKSRVTCPSVGERNYHVFYALLRGGSKEDLVKLFGDDASPEGMLRKMIYTQRSECFDATGVDDRALFKEVVDAMKTMDFRIEEMQAVWVMLASVLWVGNVDFDETSATDTRPVAIKDDACMHSIRKSAELLGVDLQEMINCITSIKRKIGSSVIVSPRKYADVIVARDSIARNVYDRLFSWIVMRLNVAINNKGGQNQSKTWIGLLDIFGFEVFKVNSFEQLCINYTNEKLQQLYVQYVFKAEEIAFAEEGLLDSVKAIQYQDNRELIEMLEKPPTGIFQLIDEASSLAASSDTKLFDSMVKMYGNHALFNVVPKTGIRKLFAITHTAKRVEYDVEGFRDKNKAEVSQDLLLLLAQSSNSFVSDVFFGNIRQGGKQCLRISQASSLELDDYQSNCSAFHRIIGFNDDLAREDLVSFSVDKHGIFIERKQIFRIKDFTSFFAQYKEILPDLRHKQINPQNLKHDCQYIIEFLQSKYYEHASKYSIASSNILLGKSKMFAKDSEGRQLDAILQQWVQVKKSLIMLIVKAFRKHKMRRIIFLNLSRLSKVYQIFLKIVALGKMRKQRRKYLNLKKAIGLLSLFVHRFQAKSALLKWKEKPKPLKQIIPTKQTLQDKQSNMVYTIQDSQNKLDMSSLSSDLSSMQMQSDNVSMFNSQKVDMKMASEINEHLRERLLSDSILEDSTQRTNNMKKRETQPQLTRVESQFLDKENSMQQRSNTNASKRSSKFERLLNNMAVSPTRQAQKVESEDRFLDFSSSNQSIILKIQQNKYFEMCATIFVDRKKNFNEQFSLSERASYQTKPLTKPLTSIPKHTEPVAVKSFLYMLKYADDRPRREKDRREVSCKLVKLILQQEDQEVSDEIFLQIVKQLTNNSTPSLERYFELGGLVSSVVTLSTRIAFGVMNFFYEQANYYQDNKAGYYEQWCKFILLRVGNNLVYSDRNTWDTYSFRRVGMPLKEEFLAIQRMRSIPIEIHLYGETSKTYYIESYTKICNLIGMIALDLAIATDTETNWYGIVEYLYIDGCITSAILDFSERVMDWKAKRTKARNLHLASSANSAEKPVAQYEFRLYFQTVILHQASAKSIDTTLMLYTTYVNEFLHGLYYFDINSKENTQAASELDCVIKLAASKVIADSGKGIDKAQLSALPIDINLCVPITCRSLLASNLWEEKIKKELVHLSECTSREAKTIFLTRMKTYQGKYFMTQKYFCSYDCNTTENKTPFGQSRKVVVLTKLGYIYILACDNQQELQEIPLQEISHFAIDFNVNATKLIIHTKKCVIVLGTQSALNLYYNIDYYITEVSKLENNTCFSQEQYYQSPKKRLSTQSNRDNQYHDSDDEVERHGKSKRSDFTAEKLIQNRYDSEKESEHQNRRLFQENNDNQINDMSIHLYDSLL